MKTTIAEEQELTEFGYMPGDRTVTTTSCNECLTSNTKITKLRDLVKDICFKQLQESDYCQGCEEHSDKNGTCACIREVDSDYYKG